LRLFTDDSLFEQCCLVVVAHVVLGGGGEVDVRGSPPRMSPGLCGEPLPVACVNVDAVFLVSYRNWLRACIDWVGPVRQREGFANPACSKFGSRLCE
jgi:hypothetical protein